MGRLRRAAPLVAAAAAAAAAIAAAAATRRQKGRPLRRSNVSEIATNGRRTAAATLEPGHRWALAPLGTTTTPPAASAPPDPQPPATATADSPVATSEPDDPAAPAHPAAPTDTTTIAPATTTPPATGAGEPTRASANGAGAAHAASRRGLVAVLVAVVLVVVLGVGALVVAGAGGEPKVESSRGEDPPVPTTVAPTTTSVPPPSPAEAFTLAAGRLEDAGSFGYRGVVSGTDVSAVRPSLWVAVDTTVDGEVELPTGRLHEVAVADSGKAAETVADGSTVWGRSAATVADLAGRGFQRIPALSTAEPATKGVTNLPVWLAGAVGPAAAWVDPQGRRQYQATVPAALIGPTQRGQRAVDATIVLVLDRRNQPAHVEITTLPGGPPLHLALDITGLGTPVGIVPPA